MTISERISSEGIISGKLARLGSTVYERRGSGEWRKAKDQGRALRLCFKAEREATEEARRANSTQRAAERVEAALAAKRNNDLTVTVAHTYRPVGRAAVADFARWAAKQRKVS